MGVINEWIWQLSERKARDLLEISYVGRRRVSYISGSQFEPIDWTEKRSEAAVAGTGPDCAAHDSRTIKILPAGQKNKLSM